MKKIRQFLGGIPFVLLAACVLAISHAMAQPLMEDTGTAAGAPVSNVSGTVESYNDNSGILRVRATGGNITSYLVTSATKILDGGKSVSANEIDLGDSLTVYPSPTGSNNEAERIELHD